MWLEAASALWCDEDDPLPLLDPFLRAGPPYAVRQRLLRTGFRPEWGATRALMEGAKSGFTDSFQSWYGIEDMLDRLPAETKLSAAQEGFWREDSFGEWSRTVLADAICVHTTECWLLPIHGRVYEVSQIRNCKHRVDAALTAT